jgi:precorrin-4/cobalt-precorrin-4 C11-methyltransferase
MPPGESLATYAATGATLVLHLAVQRIAALVPELLPHYGADCPAAVVAYASRDDELILRGTLADIAGQVEEAGVRRTAVVIVGRVLAAAEFPDSHLYSVHRSR